MTALDRLTWSTFFSTWRPMPGWLEATIVILGVYLIARRIAGSDSSVRAWRVVSFCVGMVGLYASIASAIGTYAMSVFWMHMVLHLILIMVIPALLVLGHPITVLVEALPPRAEERARRILDSRVVGALTHPVTGTLVYTATIIGTHLTGFMDQMAMHSPLMTGEQILYVVAGYWFLMPMLGEEPIRRNPPYLLRLVLLVAAMVPDTIVGIVLLQTSSIPFPMMMMMRPAWAPDALSDIHTAGGLMWAAGDGAMMLIAVGLMVSVVVSPGRRAQMTGSWLDSARRGALAEHVERSGASAVAGEEDFDPDGDEALAAYNRMLAKLKERS